MDIMKEKNINSNLRIVLIAILSALIIIVFAIRVFSFSIIDGEKYIKASQTTSSKTIRIEASRGEIYDRYGNPMVVNTMGLNIQIDRNETDLGKLNETVLNLAKVCNVNGKMYYDSLPVTDAPFTYIKDEEGQFSKTFLKFLKDTLKVETDISANELMKKLKDFYEIKTDDEKELRIIAGIRYEMSVTGFSKSSPIYTFAQDINNEIAAKITENIELYSGVTIEKKAKREYRINSVGSNIVGRIGKMFAEEYTQELKDKGYLLSDLTGKDGVEKAFEEYLRGTNGYKKTIKDRLGNIISEEIVDPIPGYNVTLTIDMKLQEVAEKALAEAVAKCIEEGKQSSSGFGSDAAGAAAVVIKIKTGEVLCMANYPTYNVETYSRDYNSLIADPLKPLFNRSISGTYAPGSTYKLVTATTGLLEKKIDLRTVYKCSGVYRFYEAQGYAPRCYDGLSHGAVDLEKAIEKSCNGYFFDAARLSGIEALEKYAALLGFGQKTGIELLGEASGVVAGKTNSAKSNKQWTAGNTLAAAIGQSDNRMTPIQLCNMAATIANNGVRYKTTIVQSIRNSYTGEVLKTMTPQVAATVNYDKQTLTAIKNGMRRVIVSGSGRQGFSGYDIEVAGKTGTAEVPKGSPNILFAGYAPYDNPEIAVCVVIEHGGKSVRIAEPVRKIISAYFNQKTELDLEDKIGELLE